MKTSITKEEIQQLPVVSFSGRIIVVDTIPEAEKAVAYLSSFPCIGIDTETRPSFKKGMKNKMALLQLSTPDTCFLFRLNRIALPISLAALLENEKVLKAGIALRDDLAGLKGYTPFEPKGVIELQTYTNKYRIEDNSLQKIYALLFNEKISKSQRLSNWEADTLTDAQKRYAATDAWACVKIYETLQKK